jgi:hypothetical protein
MTEEIRLYKLVQFNTMGWELVMRNDNPVEGLDREEIKDIIQEMINDGENPNRLKAIPNHVSIDELPS